MRAMYLLLYFVFAGLSTAPAVERPFDLPGGNSGQGLVGYYYSNVDLAGVPEIIRIDRQLDSDLVWPSLESLPAVGFSVRWLGTLSPPSTETYEIMVDAVGGTRVWLDGTLVLDAWGSKGGTAYSAALSLQGGSTYPLRVEYRNTAASPAIHLHWRLAARQRNIVPATAWRAPPATVRAAYAVDSALGDGLIAMYHANMGLQGTPDMVRNEANINHSWGRSAPHSSLPADNFSVRWIGTVVPPEDDHYQLIARSDDGVAVDVDGVTVINHWRDRSATDSVSPPIALEAGRGYFVEMRYYENRGNAVAQLAWQRAPVSLGVIGGEFLRPDRYLVPMESYTSPAQVEGFAIEGIPPRVSVRGKSARSFALGANAFWAEVPLSAFAPVEVEINGGVDRLTSTISWLPTSLDGGDEVVLRVGDSLLFEVPRHTNLQILDGSGLDDGRLRRRGRNLRSWAPSHPGYYTVVLSGRDGEIGRREILALDVLMPAGPVACEINYRRRLTVEVSPVAEVVHWSGLDGVALSMEKLVPKGADLHLMPRTPDQGQIVSRITGPTGRLLAVIPVQPYRLTTNMRGGFIYHRDAEGYGHAPFTLYMQPKVPGQLIELHFFSGTATIKGRSKITILSDDLDAEGSWSAEVLMDPGSSVTCHRIKVFEVDGEKR